MLISGDNEVRDMETTVILEATIGGVLIGLAASALLFFNGRISGVSGIVGGALTGPAGDRSWRLFFIGGLLLGGVATLLVQPSFMPTDFEVSGESGWILVGLGGLLVGFGTRLGGGCTSGHGVCGVSRLSPRSIVATVTFMSFGILAVFVAHSVLGL
jgi:uncharacterized membrane protein YedE/YeeE